MFEMISKNKKTKQKKNVLWPFLFGVCQMRSIWWDNNMSHQNIAH